MISSHPDPRAIHREVSARPKCQTMANGQKTLSLWTSLPARQLSLLSRFYRYATLRLQTKTDPTEDLASAQLVNRLPWPA